MANTVRVTLVDGWAVFHDGEQSVGGTTVEVDQATAEHWLERGWARLKAVRPRTSPR